MRKFSLLVILFAFVILAGGVMGYVKAGSVLSFAIASVAASSLILCGYLGYYGKFGGLVSAALIIIALDFFFIYRVLKTTKFMPGGALAVLCTLVCIPLLNFLKAQAYEQGES